MGKQLDLTGQRFGKLVVVGLDPNYIPKSGRHKTWLCKCDCGRYKVARGSRLISGYTTACSLGCNHQIDIGTRFGKLTVLEMTDERSKNGGSILYRCRCDCGEELLVPSTELRTKRKSSCHKCNISFGESTIEEILKQNNIIYLKEYSFKNLYNQETNRPFRFDFYLPELNIIIEYDGEQHTKAIVCWGGEKRTEGKAKI